MASTWKNALPLGDMKSLCKSALGFGLTLAAGFSGGCMVVDDRPDVDERPVYQPVYQPPEYSSEQADVAYEPPPAEVVVESEPAKQTP